MKTKRLLGLGIFPFLFALVGCQSKPAVTKRYVDGMTYHETTKREAETYYSLSYDAIGGDEVMPIGGFYGPYASGGSVDGHNFPNFVSEKYFQYLEDAGINLLVYSRDFWTYQGGNANLTEALDLAEAHHMGYFVYVDWIANQLGQHMAPSDATSIPLAQDDGKEILADVIDEVSDSGKRKAFVGVHGMDEPFPKQFDSISLFSKTFYEICQEKGYSYDIFYNSLGRWNGENNFFGAGPSMNYESYMEQYFDEITPRMFSCTQYPFTSESTEESALVSPLYYGLDANRYTANKYHVPFWRMLQAGGQHNDAAAWIPSVDPYPSEGETLYDVNLALAYGAKAIQYFPLIQPLYYAYKTGGTYDFDNRCGLIGADGNLTRWYYYAKRANAQIQAIDHVLMKSANDGVLVHGDTARHYIVDEAQKESSFGAVLEGESYRELSSISGGDCVVGCFDYKGGTALYVVNYNRKEKADITLHFDRDDYRYTVTQRAESVDVVGNAVPLRLDAGEGALIVLA